MKKNLVVIISFIVVFFELLIPHVKANTSSDYLIHINENFDKHPIHLTSYRYGYWIKQASLFKKAAVLGLPNSALCEKGNYGSLILSFEPHIFYNPKMTVFYGTLKTKIYNQEGKVIKKIKNEEEIIGRLDILYEVWVDRLYKKLLLSLDEQIKKDSELNQILSEKTSTGIEGSFCLMLD